MNMHKLIKTNQESGFASITIAIVLIVVLALTTIGFAQLSRREQQSALNKQLSAQANYAAESGINDVQNYIKASIKANPANPDLSAINSPDGCMTPIAAIDGKVAQSRDVEYSCVIADPEPKDLGATIGAFGSWTTTFETDDLAKLKVIWKSTGNKTPKSNMSSKFQKISDWGNAPAVLQVSITPLSSANARNDLIKNTFTTYMYPASATTDDNSVAYSSFTADKGPVISGRCNPTCTSSIDTLPNPNPAGADTYLLRIVGNYDESLVTVEGYTSANAQLKLRKSQAKIDVTGKARNVLKRLQVRVPLNDVGGYDLPNYAIEAKNVCKRIETEPNRTGYVPVGGGAISSTDPCYLGE